MKVNFVEEQVPDATTLLKFRRLMEKHKLGHLFSTQLPVFLEKHGRMMRGGTIVDATLISAPSSTKNATKSRDPEMHQTQKGKAWHFGMKCHSGVDAGSGYVHSLEITAANEHDITVAHTLIREDDAVVYGDSGYLGLEKRAEISNNPQFSTVEYRINRRPSQLCKAPPGHIDWNRQIEKGKSSVRCKVEHPFLIVKRYFGYAKTVYKGLAKNAHRLHVLFASSNLLMCARAGRKLRPA